MTKFGDVLTTDEVPTGGTTILNGTGPPADALGAVGNYYLDTVGKVLYGPKAAAAGYGPDGSTLNIVPSGSQTVGASTMGSRLKMLAVGRLTGLRYYRYAGNATAHAITLILYLQSTQAEVARVVVNNVANAPAGWVVGTLATPVTVAAGSDYRVGYSHNLGSLTCAYQAIVPVSAIPSLVSWTGNCYTVGTPNVYPSTDDATACYFVDVVFQALTSWPVALKSAP